MGMRSVSDIRSREWGGVLSCRQGRAGVSNTVGYPGRPHLCLLEAFFDPGESFILAA